MHINGLRVIHIWDKINGGKHILLESDSPYLDYSNIVLNFINYVSTPPIFIYS